MKVLRNILLTPAASLAVFALALSIEIEGKCDLLVINNCC